MSLLTLQSLVILFNHTKVPGNHSCQFDAHMSIRGITWNTQELTEITPIILLKSILVSHKATERQMTE